METTITYIIVQVSTETAEQARTIAQAVVEAKLGACVHIMPMQSVYEWEGTIHHDSEHLILIKTHIEVYPSLETLITQQHSYDVPEIIATPIVTGLSAYLAWIDETVQRP